MITARRQSACLWTCLAVSSLAFWYSGCTMVDGTCVYHVEGTLVAKAEQAPATDTTVAVTMDSVFKPAEESPDWRGFVTTTKDGQFAVDVLGHRWGYTLLLGFIPIGSAKPPVPPVVERVYLYYRPSSDSQWAHMVVPVPSSAQSNAEPGNRWVRIGTVQVAARAKP